MSFGGQNKALVLLITETTTRLMSWQQGTLHELAMYTTSPDDQDQFVAQIRQYPRHPVIIVTDLIDENYRHDTIVHVGGGDREALLKRKLDFAFRNTRYRTATVIARQADGRKDDRILLSALSKPERIDVWAKLLLQEKMAVQSVTSIAHLLNTWLPLEKLEQEENLLISKLDNNFNLRQTFVKNGRVMFSRLASLTTVPERRLGMEILQESIQLRQYLERIQFLNYESPLRILVLSCLSADAMQLDSFSSDLNRFATIDIRDRSRDLSIDVDDSALLPSHYLIASILKGKSIENAYAPASLTRYADLRSLGKYLLAGAAAVLALGLGLNLPGLFGVIDKRDQAASMNARITPMRDQYQTLTSRFPETPIPPREMQLLVDTYKVIESQLHTPMDSLNLVAAALANSPGLELTKIDWALVEIPYDSTPDALGNVPPPPSMPAELRSVNALTGAILQQRTQIQVVINGEAYSQQSYREAQEQVSRFISALRAAGSFEVVATQMPIDIRTDVEVTATINDSEVRSAFTLQLTLPATRPTQPAQLAGAAP